MSESENLRAALDDITKSLADPDANYTEEELQQIAALQKELKARLQLTEAGNV